MPPPSDIRDAAAAAAVGTTPVETPGFDRCNNLKNNIRLQCIFTVSGRNKTLCSIKIIMYTDSVHCSI